VRGLAVGLAAALLAVGAAAPPARALEGTYSAVVTRIAVKLVDRISSQDARVGDIFRFDTTSSVALDGLFLPAGTHGRGVVIAARPARGPQPGELRLAARSIDVPGGGTMPVGLERGRLDRRLSGDVRGFTVPVGGRPVYVGADRATNVVYERGTEFVVIAPPPASPEPRHGGISVAAFAKRSERCQPIDRSA